ncbi:MAG: hypothetical protein PUD40_04025 [Bacteroidales bacterium]|nr:hypothetical protein [Bacteroidales bacterium]
MLTIPFCVGIFLILQFVRKGKEYLPFGQIFSARPAQAGLKSACGLRCRPRGRNRQANGEGLTKRQISPPAELLTAFAKQENLLYLCCGATGESPDHRAFPLLFSSFPARKWQAMGKTTKHLGKTTKDLGKFTKDLVENKSDLEKTTSFAVH